MVYRIDVRPAASSTDPQGESVRNQIKELGTDPGPVRSARIYLVDADSDQKQIDRAARELLADPIVESFEIFSQPRAQARGSLIEIHLKPGVMDPVAASTEMALRDMDIAVKQVRTGRAYAFEKKIDRIELEKIAARVLANGVIESVHFERFLPREFPAAHEQQFRLRTVPLRGLADANLTKLSRDAHRFL